MPSMRSVPSILIGVSLVMIYFGLYFVYFWYGGIYEYFCSEAGQCANILQSSDHIGLYGLIAIVVGIILIAAAIFVRKKYRAPSSNLKQHDLPVARITERQREHINQR